MGASGARTSTSTLLDWGSHNMALSLAIVLSMDTMIHTSGAFCWNLSRGLKKEGPRHLHLIKTIAAFNIHSQIPLHNLRSIKPCYPPLSTSSFFSCRSSSPDRNSENIYAYRTVYISQPATATALSPLFGSNSKRRKFVIPLSGAGTSESYPFNHRGGTACEISVEKYEKFCTQGPGTFRHLWPCMCMVVDNHKGRSSWHAKIKDSYRKVYHKLGIVNSSGKQESLPLRISCLLTPF